MHVVLPTEDQSAWFKSLGYSRDELLAKILADDWLKASQNTEAVLVVSQLEGVSFGLGFNIFPCADDIKKVRFTKKYDEKRDYRLGQSQFDVIFDYNNNAEHICIHEVHFGNKQQGMGTAFLERTLNVLLDIGGKRIYASPAFDGSVFWTRRGCLLQRWPESFGGSIVSAQILKILHGIECVRPVNWSKTDLDALHQAMNKKDFRLLNEIVVGDLKVERPCVTFNDEPQITLAKFLFQDVPLGMNYFDVDHPLTQECLLKRMGYDVVAERAKRAQIATRHIAPVTSRPLYPSA